MNTSTHEGAPIATEDILEGLFDVDEGHSTDPGDVSQTIKSYLTIDDKFKELPPDEGLARTIQSKMERLKGELKGEITKSEELGKQARFLGELKENPELRQAWLNEVDPDSSVDVDTMVTKALNKEGFKDFQPNDEEKNIPTSQTAKYYRRANYLYSTYENNQSNKTVKEILALSEQNANKTQKKLADDLKQIETDEKWDKSTMSNFIGFAQKFDIYAIKKVFKYKLADATARTGVGSKSSSSGVVHGDQITKAVNDKFGKPKSGKLKPKD